ncbi:MAG: MFS transporter, partial [Acidimicrobiia bacterium]|nr:MFS transporter [Acidimicrobiia bacterium]
MTPAPTRASTRAWILYDLANTIFAFGVTGLYFALWLKDEGQPDSAIAIPTAIAMSVVVVIGPWIGARTDHSGRRVPVLVWGTIVTIAATGALATFGVPISLVLFVIALIGFNIAGVAYDALLPDVSTDETIGKVSGLGVGFGYFGSVVGFGIGYVLSDVLELGSAAVFRALAIAFLLFALPSFFKIVEPERPKRSDPPPTIRQVFSHLFASWKRARTVPGVARFLVGRFLYTDAINTLTGGFLAIFATRDMGLTDGQTQLLLIEAVLV